jgi:hypothetical protein
VVANFRKQIRKNHICQNVDKKLQKSTCFGGFFTKITYVQVFVSRALKSVFVDLSLPKRRALFDFLRDPQFVKSKLTYLFMRTAKRPWTDWHGWNSTIILDFGATSIKWVSRHETMVTKLGVFTKTVKFEVSVSSKKCPSPVGEVSSTPILHDDIVNRLTRNDQ